MNIKGTLRFLVPCAIGFTTGCVAAEDLEAVDTEAEDESSSAIVITSDRYYLPAHGGNGGNPHSFACPAGSVLVGFSGRAGNVIDRLEPICARMNPNGTLEAPSPSGAVYGGGGGTPFPARACGPGEAVVGFFGRAGHKLDRLNLQCANVGQWFGASTLAGNVYVGGGGGGTAFGGPQENCPAPYVITGLQLRAGSKIDKIQGVCSLIRPSPMEVFTSTMDGASAGNTCMLACILQTGDAWSGQWANYGPLGACTCAEPQTPSAPEGRALLPLPWLPHSAQIRFDFGAQHVRDRHFPGGILWHVGTSMFFYGAGVLNIAAMQVENELFNLYHQASSWGQPWWAPNGRMNIKMHYNNPVGVSYDQHGVIWNAYNVRFVFDYNQHDGMYYLYTAYPELQ